MRRPIIAAAIALLTLATPARAADTIKIITPFAAGGPADMLARLLADELAAPLSANVIVENRGGAGGVLGTEAVARSAPDGRTLLLGSMGSHVISAALHSPLGYDSVKSFTPIALVGSVPALMIVNRDLPAASLQELVALAKSGRAMSYASAGPGTTMNIAGEMLNAGAGIKLTHVPYRGAGPAINDLLGGHVDVIIADPPVLLPLVSNNSVRALALFGKERSALLPTIATTAELGFPDMLMENWYGVFAPAGMSAETSARLEQEILAALATPRIKERLAAGGLAGALGRADFSAKLERDVAYWDGEIKKLGIKGE